MLINICYVFINIWLYVTVSYNSWPKTRQVLNFYWHPTAVVLFCFSEPKRPSVAYKRARAPVALFCKPVSVFSALFVSLTHTSIKKKWEWRIESTKNGHGLRSRVSRQPTNASKIYYLFLLFSFFVL